MPECPKCGKKLEDTIDVICLECDYKFSRSIVEIINEVEALKEWKKEAISWMDRVMNTIDGLENKIEVLEDKSDKRSDWFEFLEDKVKALEGKIRVLEKIVKNGYTEEGLVEGIKISTPSLIEIDNIQKKQIEALKSEIEKNKKVIYDTGQSFVKLDSRLMQLESKQ